MKSIDIHHHPIHYVEAGDPRRPTLILLTGWAEDRRLYKNVVPHLAEDFHVLSPDFRGHDPDLTLHGDFTTSDLADDILAFAAAKNVEGKFHLVSHSHGCWVNVEICERLGAQVLDRTVLIDWLMEPHPGFRQQVSQGRQPALYAAARKSMFDEWAAKTNNADVLNHIYNEMPSFGGEMWMRANREIENAYDRWGSPLKRMAALKEKPEILHIFSQPLDPAYRELQKAFAAEHTWFHPHYLPGETHFPSLENGAEVALLVKNFFGASPKTKG